MTFPKLDLDGLWLGRVERPDIGPCVVTMREGRLVDITSETAPTVRDVLERRDAPEYVRAVPGTNLGDAETDHNWLAPCDLQAIKACGVTFAGSTVERVIEEQAAGDPTRAQSIRNRIGSKIGASLSNIVPGSDDAAEVKEALISEGLWSQYLEVGIGPDAEVFSKAQVLSSVGFGADIGLHPISTWNNPEPEVVLAVSSRGRIKGATLGNDVNLRDVEGRSALLLSKAKDNNASCSIGPMIRLFDETFSLDDVRSVELALTVAGPDGFELSGNSSMSRISRDPEDLVRQTIGPHHQYPDGLMLFLGTLFAPTQDRDVPGGGFTHKLGDIVTIKNDKLGSLINTVRLSTECAEWRFGASHLMRNLAGRGLL
ncbi:fumarylacetoacetate hydrolase family protein [Nitratireductor sp. XY-223]|uniref:fumarylacetoacetate hydrolase family protein n=1 Tax=Nitratireductor sp. XY-223 TaxID=2561926 RepID=UPI0010AAA964|nr:fumarylacetoacetate hydrolase family protein [Nitratireductor sp. XY-223]